MAGAESGGEEPRAVTVVQVAAGEAHTLALTASGSVYAWGRGLFGRLGVGVFQDELIPTLVEIVGMEDDDSSQSSHSDSFSTREDSRSGQLRDRDVALRSKITQVTAGAYHSLALAGDGTVWSWGYNACQLGRDRAASYPAPVAFPFSKGSSLDDVRKSGNLWSQGGRDCENKQSKVILVEAGGMISSAVDQEGGLWLWGAVPPPSAKNSTPDSSPYTKAEFSLANIEKPERVHALMGMKVYRVACGNEHILALVEGRDAIECYAWGSNSSGQLGLGDLEPRSVPTLVSALAVAQVGTIVDLACGAFHSAVITVKDDEPGDMMLEPTASPMQRRMQPSPQLMAQVMGSPKLRGRPTPEQYIEAMASPKLRARQGDRYLGYPYPGEKGGSGNYSGYSAYSDSSSSPKLSSRGSSQISMMSTGGRMQGKKEGYGVEGRVSICWTFGQGENGQLGQGTATNLAMPAPVDGLPSRERLRTVVCGLFHTGVVTETGDVWVWGMEGGLGLCPGIGPPGSRSGDTLIPVRVFGESSAKCHPVTGSKGIACGAAHTVTVSNGGRDIWAWGRGQSGVLGLGHASDSWFPCPVVWPPGSLSGGGGNKDTQQPEIETVYETRRSSRASSRTGSKGRGDEIRPYAREVEDSRPPRSASSSRKPVDFTRPSRRGDDFRPPREREREPEPEEPRPLFRRETGPETTSMSMSAGYENGTQSPDDVSALKAELAECRRYAESLHAAVFGGLETFSQESMYMDAGSDAGSSERGRSNGQPAKNTALQDWQRRIEAAPDQELLRLELFYKGMRNRLKDVLFQRKMEDWCRRCMSALSSSPFQEPPPVPEPFSAPSTPSLGGPSEFAVRMSGILADRGDMLPPAAIAASIAEFRMLSQRRR